MHNVIYREVKHIFIEWYYLFYEIDVNNKYPSLGNIMNDIKRKIEFMSTINIGIYFSKKEQLCNNQKKYISVL